MKWFLVMFFIVNGQEQFDPPAPGDPPELGPYVRLEQCERELFKEFPAEQNGWTSSDGKIVMNVPHARVLLQPMPGGRDFTVVAGARCVQMREQ